MFELSNEDVALIATIKIRAQNPLTATTMAKYGYGATVNPSVSLQEIEHAETALGFPLPALIREIYLQVGNGGFGPGYGVVRLADKATIFDEALVDSTLLNRQMREYIEGERASGEYDGYDDLSGWHWGTHYSTYCFWGCTVTSVVDCSDAALPVYALDCLTMRPHSSGTLRQWWMDWLNDSIEQY